ncbi:AAA family ATPase [Myroides fluvii]|uniref:AAA family ATPase n=1 Tax=Myroides fluvii TaxID=2572594 RepID=UPI00131D5C5E|nr:ATP-dependent Clp protease ATP-binding subunit [Myroides fluvii]
MNEYLISNSVQDLMATAKLIAKENCNSLYSGAHILKAMMHEEAELCDFVTSLGEDVAYVADWATVRIEEYPKTTQLALEPQPDIALEDLMENAEDIRRILGLATITSVCILTSLVKPGIFFTKEQLLSLPLKEVDMRMFLYDRYNPTSLNGEQEAWDDRPSCIEDRSLDPCLIDLIQKLQYVENEGLIVGREGEVRALIEILGRKSKPNVILVGEPGVGKTAIMDGVAKLFKEYSLPNSLKYRTLFQLDFSSLVMGTTGREEVEGRFKSMLKSCRSSAVVLFIDDIHVLVDPKSNFGGLHHLLKAELGDGPLIVIGTTTTEEYRKLIEPEASFSRKFEKLEILEPNPQTCVKMLENKLKSYERYHSIGVEPEALDTCVMLAKRYAKDKKLPDTAFDLLDRTMAAAKLNGVLSRAELMAWWDSFKHDLNKTFVDDQGKSSDMLWNFNQLQQRISPILWGALKEVPQLELSMGSTLIGESIQRIHAELLQHATQQTDRISSVELAAVMAAKTGIPLGKIQVQEKEKLLALKELLGQSVVGQEHALQVVSDAIIESRSGLQKPGQPIGSFFFLGPTGTGKTELAKTIASLLFNDEKAMIRFDMSEFKEEHAAALLYGAPPGYVGYEEGGMLVNKIRQQPYAVVLFDEIEKAHPSVFDVFLQLMDEGKIHDKLGKVGDFSNALILFTSNIGSEQIVTAFENQEIPTSKELIRVMKGHFRPEFLARITEIVPFSPITEQMAEQIFSIQLKAFVEACHRLQIAFEITDLAIKKLAISGFNSAYGARQINGVLRQEIAQPISKMIVKGEVKTGQKIKVDWQNDAVVFHILEQV